MDRKSKGAKKMQGINPLYIQALQYAVENQSASITIFQRIFHIGYMGNEPTFKKRQKTTQNTMFWVVFWCTVRGSNS